MRPPFDGWAKRDGILENFYPRNVATIAVISAGAAWTWPAAYTQLVAATVTDFVPHILHATWKLNMLVAALTGVQVEYEIATGAAGAEVPFARYTWGFYGTIINPGAGTQSEIHGGDTFPMGPTLIPSGTRIAARVRISQAVGTAISEVDAYIGGYDGGAAPASYDPYSLRAHLCGVHRSLMQLTPTGATIGIGGAAFPGYGAPVQVLAAAPKDLLVWGASKVGPAAGLAIHTYMELMTGAAGFEIPRARIAFPGCTSGSPGVQQLYRPVLVRAGERLSARTTGSAGVSQYMFFYEVN